MYLILNPVTSTISSFNTWRNWAIDSDFPRLHSELSGSAGIWTLALWYQNPCSSSLHWFSSQYPFSLSPFIFAFLLTYALNTYTHWPRTFGPSPLDYSSDDPGDNFMVLLVPRKFDLVSKQYTQKLQPLTLSVTCSQCLSLFLCISLYLTVFLWIAYEINTNHSCFSWVIVIV